MTQHREDKYFFSIQPLWKPVKAFDWHEGLDGTVSISSFHWDKQDMESVAGNGQVGIVLQGPEDFKGVCYGVVESRESISLHGVTQGIFIRFAPGTFSKAFGIPAKLVDPLGVPLENLFSPKQLILMKDAMASSAPEQALLKLIETWADHPVSFQEHQLAMQVAHLIWCKRGHIRIRELEDETAYSSRRLQDVLNRQVGIAPKQMCRQVRFQNALHMLQHEPDVSLVWLAQTLGYCDQAHFNKDFKCFAGLSPSQLRRETEPAEENKS